MWNQSAIIRFLGAFDWMFRRWPGMCLSNAPPTLSSPYRPVKQSSSPTNATCCSKLDTLSSSTPPLPVVLFFLGCSSETKNYM